MTFLALLVVSVFAVSPAFSAQHGQKCESQRDCSSTTTECIHRFAECKEKGCWCKLEYGGRFAPICHKILGPYDRCRYTSMIQICPFEEICDSATDRCVRNRTYAGEACSVLASSLLPCTAGAYCNGSVCLCHDYYDAVGGKCKIKSFDKICNSMQDGQFCKTNALCLGEPISCQCVSNYTRESIRFHDQKLERCLHTEGVKDLTRGKACTLVDYEKTGRVCSGKLTCSKCLEEDAPTCMRPTLGETAGAGGLNGSVWSLLIAVLMTTYTGSGMNSIRY